MRIRPGAVFVVVVVLVSVCFVYGFLTSLRKTDAIPEGEVAARESDEDAFLQEAREAVHSLPTAVRADVRDAELPGVVPDEAHVPILALSADKIDCTVPNLGKTQKTLELRNAGTTELVITGVRTSCGCTSAAVGSKNVPPGQSTTLTVTIDPARISPGFESRKQVSLKTNDPAHRNVSIPVIARVEPEFLLEPQSVSFGKVEKGTRHEATLLFRRLNEEPVDDLAVVAPRSNPDGVEVAFVRRPAELWSSPDRPEFDINVTLLPDAPMGEHLWRFDIVAPCKRLKTLRTYVRADVQSFYTLSPRRSRADVLPIGALQVGGTRAKFLKVASEEPFEILDLTISAEDLEVKTTPGDEPNTVFFDLVASPSAQQGLRKESVAFTVKGVEETAVETINLTGYVVKQNRRIPVPVPETSGGGEDTAQAEEQGR